MESILNAKIKAKAQEAIESFDEKCKGTLNKEEAEKLLQYILSKEGFTKEQIIALCSNLPSLPSYSLDAIKTVLGMEKPKMSTINRGLDSIGLSTEEQMIPAARIIYILQQIKKKFDLDPTLANEINWCIEQIGIGSIYQPVSSGGAPILPSPRSQALPWIAQFSTPELDMNKIQDMLKKNALIITTPDQAKLHASARVKRRSIDAQNLADEALKVQEVLETVNSANFSIIDAESSLGRERTLPLVAYKIFEENSLFDNTTIDESAFVAFINRIRNGYVNNPYHNDIHATDVLQMCHYLINQCKVKEIAKLTDLDVAALYLAAIVHDYRHPGVTNGFLINTDNELAIAYNDKSVLENFHVSEAYKLIIKNDTYNLFKDLTSNERIVMRKRIISCVLATDMAIHGAMVQRLKNLMILHSIQEGKNSEKIINPKEEFDSKQFVLNLCLHFSDCANPCREFKAYKELVIRLMEEFGRQGDVEKSLNLPVTFLCDRVTLNLPSTQIGFISGVVKPMTQMLVNVFPQAQVLLDHVIKNEAVWKNSQFT